MPARKGLKRRRGEPLDVLSSVETFFFTDEDPFFSTDFSKDKLLLDLVSCCEGVICSFILCRSSFVTLPWRCDEGEWQITRAGELIRVVLVGTSPQIFDWSSCISVESISWTTGASLRVGDVGTAPSLCFASSSEMERSERYLGFWTAFVLVGVVLETEKWRNLVDPLLPFVHKSVLSIRDFSHQSSSDLKIV